MPYLCGDAIASRAAMASNRAFEGGRSPAAREVTGGEPQ